MNSRTASPGRLQFIAGGIDESDINQQSVNIFKSLIRETKEEIGVDLTNSNLVEKVRPRYIVHWGSVALVYLIQLAIDRSELQNRYKQFEIALKKAGVEPEFSSIILLSADCESISNFLKYDNRHRLDFLSDVLKKELNMG
nr:NUDIX hydrolase [Heyndrickxia oleronia]